jgi:hypothetical protein
MFDEKSYQLLSYKSVAQMANNMTFSYYYYKLMLIARALFEWESLPNNMDERWIEKYLFTSGKCIFFKDPTMGYMVAGLAQQGSINCYGDPTTVYPVAENYVYNGPKLINGENCYVIRNNDLMLPEFPIVRHYAFKLCNIDRAIDVNIEAQKTAIIVRCSDKQRLSLKNAINQRRDNEPVIWTTDQANIADMVDTLQISAPPVFKDLQTQKHMILNEVFTDFGINNANMDKRERMVANEVEANNEQVKASEDVLLKAREEACKNINRIFGLNMSVKRRELDEIPEYKEINEEKIEGEE